MRGAIPRLLKALLPPLASGERVEGQVPPGRAPHLLWTAGPRGVTSGTGPRVGGPRRVPWGEGVVVVAVVAAPGPRGVLGQVPPAVARPRVPRPQPVVGAGAAAEGAAPPAAAPPGSPAEEGPRPPRTGPGRPGATLRGPSPSPRRPGPRPVAEGFTRAPGLLAWVEEARATLQGDEGGTGPGRVVRPGSLEGARGRRVAAGPDRGASEGRGRGPVVARQAPGAEEPPPRVPPGRLRPRRVPLKHSRRARGQVGQRGVGLLSHFLSDVGPRQTRFYLHCRPRGRETPCSLRSPRTDPGGPTRAWRSRSVAVSLEKGFP